MDSLRSRVAVARIHWFDTCLMSLVQIYLDAVTHQVITSEELAYVAGNQDDFDRTEQKLSARLEHLISCGSISVGFR
ncbi:MAG: hypothetical protein CBB80_013120 [Synechococcus sp. TMED20]|nr:MAG: hypothetical protein CBB80_013120 [Synechococcus sp. TMED20]